MTVVHATGEPRSIGAGVCAASGADWRPGDPIVTHRIADGLSGFRRACLKCAAHVAARASKTRSRRRRTNGNA
jgi:hypothetical protein